MNRSVELQKAVTVTGDLTAEGSVEMGGVTWPASAGSVGTVPTIAAGAQLEWQTPGGSFSYNRTVVTDATHTMASGSEVAVINRADEITTVNLPAISSAGDTYYCVADTGGSFAGDTYILIQPNGSETIAGGSEWRIYGAYNSLQFIHDGTSNWLPV